MEVTLGNYVMVLRGLGIDYHSIPEPFVPEKEEGGGYRGKVTLTEGNRFAVTFEYDYFLIEIIKKFKGAKYNGTLRTWYLPMNNKTKHFVYALIRNDNFYHTNAVGRIIDEIGEKYKAIENSGDCISILLDAVDDYLDHESDTDYQKYRIKLIEATVAARKELGEDVVEIEEPWKPYMEDGTIIF